MLMFIHVHMFLQEDLKDWTIDVFTDAFARVEESVRHGSK